VRPCVRLALTQEHAPGIHAYVLRRGSRCRPRCPPGWDCARASRGRNAPRTGGEGVGTLSQGQRRRGPPRRCALAHLDLLSERRQLFVGVERGAVLSLGLRRPLSPRRCPRYWSPTLPDQEGARGPDHSLATTASGYRCHRRAGCKVNVARLRLLGLGLRLLLQFRAATRPRHAARVLPRLVTAAGGCARVLLASPEQVRGAGWGANHWGANNRPPAPHVRLLAGRRHPS
jgi:hypothetical protein